MDNIKVDTYKFLSITCEKFFDDFQFFERGESLKKSLLDFCINHDIESANNVYKAYLDTYRIPGLEKVINIMKDFEEKAAVLLAKQRDHYVHTVNVFLYGIAIYNNNKSLRGKTNSALKYPDSYNNIEEEFLYRWGITALFHDVGYPLEVAYKTIAEFSSMIMIPGLSYKNEEIFNLNGYKKNDKPAITLSIPNMEDMLYVNSLQPKDQLINEYESKYPNIKEVVSNDILDLIAKNVAHALKCSDDKVLYKYLKSKVKQSIELGLIDHAIYSAIILLKWTNEVFLKSGWNPAYFYKPIVDCATAIFLHNSYDYIFMKTPFNLEKLNVDRHPLAFLLILCDRIQECDRKSYGYSLEKINFISSYLDIDDHKFSLRLIVEEADKNDISSVNNKINKSILETLLIEDVFEEFTVSIEKKIK